MFENEFRRILDIRAWNGTLFPENINHKQNNFPFSVKVQRYKQSVLALNLFLKRVLKVKSNWHLTVTRKLWVACVGTKYLVFCNSFNTPTLFSKSTNIFSMQRRDTLQTQWTLRVTWLSISLSTTWSFWNAWQFCGLSPAKRHQYPRNVWATTLQLTLSMYLMMLYRWRLLHQCEQELYIWWVWQDMVPLTLVF